MWLMLTTGALSIVERNPKTTPEGDTRTMVVRSRRAEWIDAFREKFCPELGETLHLTGKDYQYRAYADPDKLAIAVARAVLSIDYHNFKSATETAKHGLKDAKLRHSLHSAYSSIWNTLLDAGDGTSVYDWKSSFKGIEVCRRWGHEWKANAKTCTDCKAKNPSFPKAGPKGVFPKGYPKKGLADQPADFKAEKPSYGTYYGGSSGVFTGIEACRHWGHYWRTGDERCIDCGERNPYHPQRPPHKIWPEGYPEKLDGTPAAGAKQESAKADTHVKGGYVASELAGSDACEGSWSWPMDDSVHLPTAANGYDETGRCWYCGQRVPVTPDGELILHWADETAEVH